MHISRRSNGIYYVWYTDDRGRKKKVSTGKSRKSEALIIFRSFVPPQPDSPKHSLSATDLSSFSIDYCRYANSRYARSYRENIRASFHFLERVVGNPPLHRIGPREVEAFVAAIRSGRTDHTVRAYFVTLASAFQTAVRWEHIEENPFRKVGRPKLRELVPLHLTRDQFWSLLACEEDADLRDFYFCAVSTGMRLAELGALRWEDIDFQRRQILVRNTDKFTTKSGRNRTIPMNMRLMVMLEGRRQVGPLVFTYHGQAITKEIASRHFKKCARKAGVDPGIHFHSMRHTFATWLVQCGASIYEVQRLLGHSSIGQTQVYAHLAPSELHGTVERLLPLLEG